MNIAFDKSFRKRLLKIDNKAVLEQVKKVVLAVEAAEDISKISGVKKMQGFKTYYRIRIGDYRIGLELKGNTATFIIIAHRKDIYQVFP